jgi:transposase-like protein
MATNREVVAIIKKVLAPIKLSKRVEARIKKRLMTQIKMMEKRKGE